jgi:hypothetical protein
VRFRTIQEAEWVAQRANETDPDTGKKPTLLQPPYHEALFLYVIPEISKEEMLM